MRVELLYIWNSIPSPTVGVGLSWTVGQWQRPLHSWEFSHVNSTEELWDSKHIACKEVCTTILIQQVTDEKGPQAHHSIGNQSVRPWLTILLFDHFFVQRLSESYVYAWHSQQRGGRRWKPEHLIKDWQWRGSLSLWNVSNVWHMAVALTSMR